MEATSYFCAAIAACCGITGVAAVLMRRAIVCFAAEACGNARRGHFWVALGLLCMLLAAPAASTFPDTILRQPRVEPGALLRNALWQGVFGLGGVLASLFIVAGALFAFVRQYEERYRSGR
jgi:hypothetical protein